MKNYETLDVFEVKFEMHKTWCSDFYGVMLRDQNLYKHDTGRGTQHHTHFPILKKDYITSRKSSSLKIN